MTQHPDVDFIAVQSALAGEYSLDVELGRGGMGIVYLAREARLARQVAIKVLPPAGRLPFSGNTPAAIVNAHLTQPAPSIASAAGVVPPRLAAAVEKCLAKDPILRYRNAEAFAEAIDLAFEHAREVPTALRVWISQGEQESGPRAMLVTWGLVVGSLASVIQHSLWFVPATAIVAGSISCFRLSCGCDAC